MPDIILRKVSELSKLDGNPRYIKDLDFQKLCESLKSNPDYFQARPLILSNRTGKLIILAGNQRFEAAKAIGMKKVPTILLENLTEEREKEITIRDNVNNGSWDWDKLANEWDESNLLSWGVNLPDIPLPGEFSGENPEEEKKKAEEAITYKSQFGVIIICKDEADQEAVYQRLQGDGYQCKIVVT